MFSMFGKVIAQEKYSFRVNNIKQQNQFGKNFFTHSPTLQKKFSTWQGPIKTIIFHPADIISVILKNQFLESKSNQYIDLQDHITGAGLGATIAEECSMPFGGARSMQNKFFLHARVALAKKYPQLFKYAKLYAEMECNLKTSMAHTFIQNVSKFPGCDTEKLNLTKITTQTGYNTENLLNETIKDHVVKDIEKIFGKKFEIGKFSNEEINEATQLAKELIEKGEDLVSCDFAPRMRLL
jgi:hypothetical protein